MKERTGPGNGTFETAIRTLSGFTYYDFSLDVHATPRPNAIGAEPSVFPALPSQGVGFWSPAEGERNLMPWESYGIRLGYGTTEVEGRVTDAYGNIAQRIPLVPIQVTLDPTVMLVPVQMIRVLPPEDSLLSCPLQSYTQRSWLSVWDGAVQLDTTRGSAPDKPNAKAIHTFASYGNTVCQMPGGGTSFTERVPNFANPDEVWLQCGIQFRMVTCPGHRFGCPDLHVDSTEKVAPPACEQGGLRDFLTMRGIKRETVALPGVTTNYPIIMAVQKVTGRCVKEVVDLAEVGAAWISMAYQGGDFSYVLAHEMGHVLNLNDDNQCSDSSSHLMCSEASLQRPKIRAEDCAKARQKAAEYVFNKWQVRVTP